MQCWPCISVLKIMLFTLGPHDFQQSEAGMKGLSGDTIKMSSIITLSLWKWSLLCRYQQWRPVAASALEAERTEAGVLSPLMVPSNRAGIVRSADYCVTWSLVPSWDMWLLFAEDCNSVSVSFPPSLPLLCVIICVITIDLRIQKIISLLGWLASVNSTWILRDKLNLDVP